MGKKVLVTGQGGSSEAIWRNAWCRRDIASGASCATAVATIVGISRIYPQRFKPRSRWPRGDLKDPTAVRKAVDGQERVFHLGALIAIPYSYQNPYDVVQTNVLGTAHVLDACRASSALERVVLTSTSEVYGTARSVPIDENASAPGPIAIRGDEDRAPTRWARAITVRSICR